MLHTTANIDRRTGLKYIILGALGLTSSTELIKQATQDYSSSSLAAASASGHPVRLVQPLKPASTLAPAGATIGQSTIIPKTAGNGIYFTPSALMTVNIWNTVTNQSVTFECWYLDPQGDLKHVPTTGSGGLLNMTGLTSARAANLQTVTLPATGGTIVSFAARISSGIATTRCQTLVKAEVDNYYNGGKSSPVTSVVIYGYVYTRKDLTYPSVDSIQDPVSGEGYTYEIHEISPPASITIPTNARWKFRTVVGELQSSNNAGTRSCNFYLEDSSFNTYFEGATSPSFTTVNTGLDFIGMIGYPSPVDATYDLLLGVARCWLPDVQWIAGLTFYIETVATVAGDSAFINQLTVEEWLDPSS